jgi:lipoprotein-anchoring transpeptidase ErfK/SrfK
MHRVPMILVLSVAACWAAAAGRGPELAPGSVEAAPAPVIAPAAPAPAAPAPLPAPSQATSLAVKPDPAHRAGPLIEISLARQRLTAWQDGHVVLTVPISTGRPGCETPPGRYRILSKAPTVWSRTWKVWMPYAMRWHRGYFIHQLPHRPGSSTPIGARRLGRPDSHGCVRVGLGDAERLYRWTRIGTPVWIR